MVATEFFFVLLAIMAFAFVCMVILKKLEFLYFKSEVNTFLTKLAPKHYLLNITKSNAYVLDLDINCIYWKYCRHHDVSGEIWLRTIDSMELLVNGNVVQFVNKQHKAVLDNHNCFQACTGNHTKEYICIRLFRHDLLSACEEICFEDTGMHPKKLRWFKNSQNTIPCEETSKKNAAAWYAAIQQILEKQGVSDAVWNKHNPQVCPFCGEALKAGAVFCSGCKKEIPY